MEGGRGAEFSRVLVRVDEQLDLAAQSVVAGAREGQEGSAFSRVALERRFEQLRETRPVFTSHVSTDACAPCSRGADPCVSR